MTAGAIVLAAGKGTRFRSERAKVLHEVAGRSMLGWVLEALRPLGFERVAVVVGHQAAEVAAEARASGLDGVVDVVQGEQRGTGHAARVALESGALDGCDTVLVVPGDAPLLESAALAELLAQHRGGVTLLATQLEDPTGYGRVLRDGHGRVARIVEERDASDHQRAIREVGTSVYAFDRAALAGALSRLTTDNAQGEEYLTDAVGLLLEQGAEAVHARPEVAVGVNDRAQLADAATLLRRRILDGHMRAGVTVVDPATTYVSATVRLEADAVLLPGVHLEGATTVAAGATVGPDSRLVDTVVEAGATVTYSVLLGASLGPGATVGPFGYLRPGTRLERGAKVGTFVEVKASTVGEGSKVPHLSYVGDTTIGRDVNFSAGAITCNYDGIAKHATVIEDGAFIGSDTMLVAPVRVGREAVTGAGSAITKDVPDGALAVERSDQRVVDGYGARRAAAKRDAHG